MIRRRLIVHGRVQGVGFRWSAQRRAEELGVRGWATNRDDGCVEIVAEGSEDAVGALVEWAHEGPAHAKVHRVVVHSEELSDELSGEPGFVTY